MKHEDDRPAQVTKSFEEVRMKIRSRYEEFVKEIEESLSEIRERAVKKFERL